MKHVNKDAISGTAFLIIALLSGTIAFFLYQTGQPGTVTQPQDSSNTLAPIDGSSVWAPPSEITVYAPPGTTGYLGVSYSLGQDGHDVQNIEMHEGWSQTKSSIVIIALQGSALYQSLSNCCNVDGSRISTVANVKELAGQGFGGYDTTQFIIVPISSNDSGGGFGSFISSDTLLNNVIARDKEAVAATLPALNEQESCPRLAGETAAEFSRITWKEWGDLTNSCNTTPAQNADSEPIITGVNINSVQIDTGISDSSIQYSSPSPTDPVRLLWESQGNVQSIVIRYNLLDEQAQGQRLLFLAGVAAGLAAAFLPLGIAPLVTSLLEAKRSDSLERTQASNWEEFRRQVRRASSLRGFRPRQKAVGDTRRWPGGPRREDPDRDLFQLPSEGLPRKSAPTSPARRLGLRR